MQAQKLVSMLFPRRGLLLAVCIGLLPLTGHAADTAPAAGKVAESATMDAVLEELKAIRQLLERIERQGGNGAGKPARPTTATVKIDANKPVLGSDTAPVTVVEFTDYQCPYCLRFTQTTFPELRREFIDTGKVRWVALNLPLDFHKDAKKAAQAAHCAGEQGKFWEMRLELFRHPGQLAAEQLPEYAGTVGLDVAAFNACLASDRHLADIDKDAEDAGAVRLTGTPSFIIGRSAEEEISGRVIIGAQRIDVFRTAIRKLLDEGDAAEDPAAGAEDGAG